MLGFTAGSVVEPGGGSLAGWLAGAAVGIALDYLYNSRRESLGRADFENANAEALDVTVREWSAVGRRSGVCQHYLQSYCNSLLVELSRFLDRIRARRKPTLVSFSGGGRYLGYPRLGAIWRCVLFRLCLFLGRPCCADGALDGILDLDPASPFWAVVNDLLAGRFGVEGAA